MPGRITLDTANQKAAIVFYDDNGNVATAPDGASATFASDNREVVTIRPAVSSRWIPGQLSVGVEPRGEGIANISAHIFGAVDSAGELFAVDPVQVTVSAGGTAEAGLTLSV